MLAIIIPYYKLTFFEATLKSLAAQTCQDFKVYIGDDASTEDPSMLLEKYKGKFDFVYHRFVTNLGGTSLTQQWERCIALSGNEDWLMILGDDDVLGNTIVEEFYKNLAAIEGELIKTVRFATQIIDAKGELISDVYVHPTLEKTTDFLARKFSKQTRSSLSEYIFNASVVFKTGFRNFPLAWHADDMAVLEFTGFEYCFSINEGLVYVRLSGISLTGDGSLGSLKNGATFDFCKVLFDEYSQKFSVEQKAILLKKLEIAFWNLPSLAHYRVLLGHYWRHFGALETVCFQIRIFRTLTLMLLKKVRLFNCVQKVHNKVFKK
ncbi:glycosyltransferase family A protein [Flavobacterium sp.]|uniref:glycosyltransferase family 2 protein n=1 Tax=Flavobacterium sp. TaxID=239 RepID=UPI002606B4F7|nr:glycosyltransferase family A protein [Flavobacterium sp.]